MNRPQIAPPIRILLADDHAVVRRGLRLLLDAEPDLQVVCEAGDGAQAVRSALRQDVDLAVLDLSMPGMSGLQAVRELARLRPTIRVVILSMHGDDQYVLEAMRAGASGYVLKSEGGESLLRACRSAFADEPFVRPSLRGQPPAHSIDRENAALVAQLTPREAQVLGLIAEGHSTKEIAQLLVISPRTVERHRENLLRKLDLRNRVELTRFALRASPQAAG